MNPEAVPVRACPRVAPGVRGGLVLLLGACTPEAPANPQPDCAETVASVSPADGEEDVAHDAAVTVTFTGPVPSPTIWVDGGATDGAPAPDASASVWTVPRADPLAPDTTYTVRAEVCGSSSESWFTTRGSPVGVDLVERTYRVEIDGTDLVWIDPARGGLIQSFVGAEDSLLFMVESAGDGSIEFRGAPGWDHYGQAEQYSCGDTYSFAPGTFADPSFAVPATDVTLGLNGTQYAIFGMTLAGSFASDGSSLVDITVSGALDLRPIGFNVCDTILAIGGHCELCPSQAGGEEPGCARLVFIDPAAPLLEGLVIDPAPEPDTDCL